MNRLGFLSKKNLNKPRNWLICLTCCMLILTGTSYGAVATQSTGPTTSDGGDVTASSSLSPMDATSTASTEQNYPIQITVTDSGGTTDTVTTPITVSNTSDSTDPGLSRFDTDGDSAINRDEAVGAVIAYNTGGTIAGRSVDRDSAVEVIIAYNTAETITN